MINIQVCMIEKTKDNYLRALHINDISERESWVSKLDYMLPGIAVVVGGLGAALAKVAKDAFTNSMNLTERKIEERGHMIAVAVCVVLGIGTMGLIIAVDTYLDYRSNKPLEVIKDYKPYEIINGQDIVRIMELIPRASWEKLIARMSRGQIEEANFFATDEKIREYLKNNSIQILTIDFNTRKAEEDELFKSFILLMAGRESSNESLVSLFHKYKMLFGEDYQPLLSLFKEHISNENMKFIHQLGVENDVPGFIDLAECHYIANKSELDLKNYFY